MFENEMQTRAAICGTGCLIGLVFVLAHLPPLLLILPVAVLFLGLVADPEETHAVWYGMLNTLGIFDLSVLTNGERLNYAGKRHYFWFGEVGMATILAGVFAVPVGCFFAGRAEHTLAFIWAGVLFLPLFVFLPKPNLAASGQQLSSPPSSRYVAALMASRTIWLRPARLLRSL